MKATMMKVCDPIIFGHAVKVFFKDLIAKHAATLAELGVDFNNGFGDLVAKLDKLPADKKAEIEADIQAAYANGPALAMVNSDKGITNLHVPERRHRRCLHARHDPRRRQDVERRRQAAGHPRRHPRQQLRRHLSGHDRLLQKERRARSEDHGHACRTSASWPRPPRNTARTTRPSKSPPTAPSASPTRAGKVLFEHAVEAGDIWRACQTKDAPVQDWVKLAVKRARATGAPAVFWLDKNRAHDAQIIAKVETYLKDHDTTGLDIRILAARRSLHRSRLERIVKGQDTISVTGNVLRDYLTDLFPILEVGTSAKMLSIVPLMNGGGLFETGAGGSAPKHVAAVPRGKLPALGLPRRVLRPRRRRFEHLGETFKHRRKPRSSPTRSTPPPASSSKTTARPAASSAPSTTAAPTSTSRSTGPRPSPRKPATPN